MELAGLKLDDWLAALARHLYITEIILDRRVLVLGCGRGVSCEFIAGHGAASVLGVDSSSEHIAEARLHRPLVNVEYRVSKHSSLDCEDGAFDVVLGTGADDLRRAPVADEIARVLAHDGVLVWAAASADRPGAVGGVSFHEFSDRLAGTFGEPTMIAVQPFPALAFADYAGDQESVELDTSLAQLGGREHAVSGYVAIFGQAWTEPRPYSIVQLPVPAGAMVLGAELGVAASDADRLRQSEAEQKRLRHRAEVEVTDLRIRVAELERALAKAPASPSTDAHEGKSGLGEALRMHAEYARDLELAVAEAREYASELEAELRDAHEREVDLEHRLEAERARCETLRSQISDWRDRTAMAEGTLIKVRAEAAAAAREAEVAVAEATAQVAAAEAAAEAAKAEAASRAVEVAAEGRDELAPSSSQSGPAALPASDVIDALDEANRALEEHRVVATELEVVLSVLSENVVAAIDSLAQSAKRSEVRAIANELGARDGDVTVLTIGLKSLQARIAESAAELSAAVEGSRDLGTLEARAKEIIERLRNLSSS